MRYIWDKAVEPGTDAWWNSWHKKTFPKPSSEWQHREYERVMGRKPPPAQDSWQFEYNPRRKASREAFTSFIDQG